MSDRSYRVQTLAAIVVAAVFLAGVYWLFQLRFRRGDIYPPYSTFRADPLGCKAFYESLGAYEGVSARRALEPFDQLEDVEGSVFLNLGVVASPFAWEREFVTDMRQFIHHGGRLIISFAPVTRRVDPWAYEFEDEDSASEDEESASEDEVLKDEDEDRDEDSASEDEESASEDEVLKDEDEDRDEESRSRFMKQSLAWGLTNVVLDAEPGGTAMRSATAADLDLPDSIPGRTRLAFGAIHEDWKTLYAIDGHPVILERLIGDGTVIVSSLSYIVSNEAIKNDRHTRLLAWLVGPHDTAIFNEYLHGIVHRTGIAALARQYQLEPLFAGLLLLAALFIWRSICPLVPPGIGDAGADSDGGISTGRGSGSALVNLLRRNIPRQKILPACYNEWKRTRGHEILPDELRSGIADAFRESRLAPAAKRKPAHTYNRLHQLLSEEPVHKETS
jgi:hypothetical protein